MDLTDPATIGVVFAIIVALLSGAVGWGIMHQRINGHDRELKEQRSEISLNRSENRQEHNAIMEKIESLRSDINRLFIK